MTTNPPLPNYDMMTGQLVTNMPPLPANGVDVMVNHAHVVHVQLLDRMILIPRAIANVSAQSIVLQLHDVIYILICAFLYVLVAARRVLNFETRLLPLMDRAP